MTYKNFFIELKALVFWSFREKNISREIIAVLQVFSATNQKAIICQLTEIAVFLRIFKSFLCRRASFSFIVSYIVQQSGDNRISEYKVQRTLETPSLEEFLL